jgi:uncharacterized membrane protein YgcG
VLWGALAMPLRPQALCAQLAEVWHDMAMNLRDQAQLCSMQSERRRYYGVLLVLPWALFSGWHEGASIQWTALLAFAMLVFSVLRLRLGPTRRTRLQLKQLIAQNARLQHAPCRDEYPLAVALFGISALQGSTLADYLALRKQGTEGSFSAAAGCGDASGCGGGGGCGGCGGCG